MRSKKISMRYLYNILTGALRLSVIAGILAIAFAASPAFAQGNYNRVIDLRTPLSQDILNLLIKECPRMKTSEFERIAREVQLTAEDYELEPGFLLALMAVDADYTDESVRRYPQARLYYFNLDMGSNGGSFPLAWFDSERIANAYSAEYKRYDDREKSIAAYFVGHSKLPPNFEVSKLPQGLRDIISDVMNLNGQWSHLGERNAPQVIETTSETPKSAIELPVTFNMDEIEKSYVSNMEHFNPRLDDETGHEIFEAIRKHSEDYKEVDPRLVMALVACESSFKPEAVSRTGARGLGQLMPFTAKNFGVSDPFDIDENIGATFAYLQRELKRWSDDNYCLDRVLAAYNAGPGAVEKYSDAPYNGVPPYNETRGYVRKVVNIYFYLLPEEERMEFLRGKSRHIGEKNGSVYLAS
jgi:hypothetical protein